MKLKIKNLLIILTVICMTITGCSFKNAGDVKENKDNKFTIVTSFYPMYIMALNVADGIPNVNIVNMTRPYTGCLHDYQFTPGDLEKLENADVFIINGANMESFLDKVIEQYPNLKTIEASKNIDNFVVDSNNETNPHVWVSISNAIKQVQYIGEQLSEIDSSNKEKYLQNTIEYVQKLSALRDKMHNELDELTDKNIVTFHEAFPYFAEEFGLNIVSIIEREPGSQPSARELARTIDVIKNANAKGIFAEPQYPAKIAGTISNETGKKVYTLDPGVTGDYEKDAYIKIMYKNLQQLKEALR